jgi:isopentenyldiphosphate isomerase
MADELIDIVDKNDVLTGVQKMKSVAQQDGSFHRISHNWIYNSAGEVLLQLRASEKLLYPDKWDISVAGHVSAGEDVVTSAQREIKEEIGIEVRRKDLVLFKKMKVHRDFNGMDNNEIDYVYLCEYNGFIDNTKIQKEEVAEINFFPISKIKDNLVKYPGKFTPGQKYWFEILDAIAQKTLNYSGK